MKGTSPENSCGISEVNVVVLVKPQFEVSKGDVGKKGIVRDPVLRRKAVETIEAFSRKTGFQVVGIIASPITGAGLLSLP